MLAYGTSGTITTSNWCQHIQATMAAHHVPMPGFFTAYMPTRLALRRHAASLNQQVPTAVLLERPLVMSASLLDAYPCLRKSRIHDMVRVGWTVSMHCREHCITLGGMPPAYRKNLPTGVDTFPVSLWENVRKHGPLPAPKLTSRSKRVSNVLEHCLCRWPATTFA